ncbi:hypothetical protein NEF87_004060 [Candidatus Lokiarchaeum ossiferum]|uniref:GTP-binding protein n=1 Tax=Candidatus Lokiarchaeum ossiferum TaxID=2951803 RepID=A0ABY6HW92_9ARCH|nr:hypothetical protein NEF87_004060 [Candidatus Lokiarchaeum sp. B-35]
MKQPIKIVVGGSGAVGKTTICHLLAKKLDKFNPPKMTPGIDLHEFKKSKNEKRIAALWDLGGQERFRFIQDSYIKGAKIVIFVYSCEWIHSLKDIKSWISMIPKNDPPAHIFLIANKIDSVKKCITKEDVLDICNQHKMEYFEMSARSGEGVSEFEEALIRKIESLEQDSHFFIKKQENLKILNCNLNNTSLSL